MRIAYVNLFSGVFGGVRIIAEHLNRLSARGHECWYFTLRNSPLDWLPVHFNQAWIESGHPAMSKCDAVVATASPTWSVVANDKRFGQAKRFALVQMMEHLFHAPDSPEYKEAQANLTLPLRPIVISEWLRREMIKHNRFTPVLVRNGVDTAAFYWDPFPDQPANRKVRVLVEGTSLNQAKDVDEMSHWAIMALKNSGYEFETWGFSQSAPRWEFDRYWILPDQDTIRHIYSSCDILLKATKYEGRSCVDVEAMACGCVVNRAILEGDDDLYNGGNCLKVKYGDLDGFTRNLQRLLVDRPERERLQRNGLLYVHEHAGWDEPIAILEQSFADAAGKEMKS